MSPADWGMLGGVAAGAVAGDVYAKAKDSVAEATGNDTPEHGPIELHMLVDLLSLVEKHLHEMNQRTCQSEVDVVVQLSQVNPYRLNRRGYKHVSLLTAAAFSINVQTKVGVVQFAMNVGWNAFDVPSNSDLVIPSGGPATQNVVLRWGEDSLDIAGV